MYQIYTIKPNQCLLEQPETASLAVVRGNHLTQEEFAISSLACLHVCVKAIFQEQMTHFFTSYLTFLMGFQMCRDSRSDCMRQKIPNLI